MTRSVSVGTMIKQLNGLLGTGKVNAWEVGFIENTVEITSNGDRTSILSGKHVDKVEEVWAKHFA